MLDLRRSSKVNESTSRLGHSKNNRQMRAAFADYFVLYRREAFLFHRDAFGEVAGTVNVLALADGDVVGEEL